MLPAGVFNETYQQDMAIIRTRSGWIAFGIFLLVIVGLPALLSTRFLGIVNVMMIIMVAVVGLQLTTGYAGQINLGQSAFMGVGAYVCGALAVHLAAPIWVAIPAAGLGAALFGTAFGLAAVRIKGFYLALTTIAAQYVFTWAVPRIPGFGGSQGLRLEPARLGGVVFDTDTRMYYLILAVAALMIFGAYGLARSRTGRAFVAVRDNDLAAGMIGIHVVAYKALAFFVGAFYAGVAGSLWAYYLRYVQVDLFTLWYSVWYMGMLIVGGMGSILGAMVGTALVRSLQEVLTYLGPKLSAAFPQVGGGVWFAFMNVLLGTVIIAFLVLEPRGVVHRWNILKMRYRNWPFPY